MPTVKGLKHMGDDKTLHDKSSLIDINIMETISDIYLFLKEFF